MFSSVYVPVRAYTIRPWTDPVQNAGWGCYRRPLTVISSGRSIDDRLLHLVVQLKNALLTWFVDGLIRHANGKPDMLDMLSVCLDIAVELVRQSWSDSDKAVGVVFRDQLAYFGGVVINPVTELLEELGEQLLNCLTEPGAVTGF
ncbi:hypothetical protein F2Q69_00047062 [Brassica cretica]|uniref:Uncharacterized protein n=1 Tax=Brassica cretica TaxID=69181 RepID=A0A8S9Q0I1_BRACR|nr:hypothetical protein F2Q69_00047062 [Brassica cretica]